MMIRDFDAFKSCFTNLRLLHFEVCLANVGDIPN